MLNEEQLKQFDDIAKAMMKWLCENGHPHTTVIITPTNAELVEGYHAIETKEFLKD